MWAKTIEETKSLLASADVAETSLEYDLDEGDGQEGCDQLLWMAEHDVWLTEGMSVHSSNPPCSERLRRLIERYGAYRRAPGTRYFGRR